MSLKFKNYIFFIFILLFITVTFSFLIGSASLNYLDVWKILLNKFTNQEIFVPTWKKSAEIIVWNLRAPRILMGIAVGTSLSIVGVLMQMLTKNTLADPYILGISSGSSAGAVLVMLLGGAGIFSVSSGAFLLGLITSIIVFSSSKNRFSTSKLVLTGVAASSFFSGLTTFLVVSSPKENEIRNVMFWIAGSLAGSSWKISIISILISLAALTILFFFSREFDIMMTGDETAESLGVHVQRIRFIVVAISSLLISFIVSNTGIIGFVGLIVPHISRKIVGPRHRYLLPFSAISGSIFMLLTDSMARSLISNQEIPIGAITAVIGAPFFLWLIKKDSYSFGGK